MEIANKRRLTKKERKRLAKEMAKVKLSTMSPAEVLQQNRPYYDEPLWVDHQIKYYEFNSYEFIKDLSFKDYPCTILLFKFAGEHVLRGGGGVVDGFMFPHVETMTTLHSKRLNIIETLWNRFLAMFEKYSIRHTVIYMMPHVAFELKFNIFNFVSAISPSCIAQDLNLAYVPEAGKSISTCVKRGARSLINQYCKGKLYNDAAIDVYFGNVPDGVMKKMADKHYLLAKRKTKPQVCWDILEELVTQKKAILVMGKTKVVGDHPGGGSAEAITESYNFVYFFVSKKFSYYALNACSRNSPICTVLIYRAMQWIFDNGGQFVDFFVHSSCKFWHTNQKVIDIATYKESLSNVIFPGYRLEWSADNATKKEAQ